MQVIFAGLHIYLKCAKEVALQAYDAAEVCSGEAMLSRCLRFGRGLRVAAIDINDWAPYFALRGRQTFKSNPLDLLQPSAFV